jgi:hypothetical protein
MRLGGPQYSAATSYLVAIAGALAYPDPSRPAPVDRLISTQRHGRPSRCFQGSIAVRPADSARAPAALARNHLETVHTVRVVHAHGIRSRNPSSTEKRLQTQIDGFVTKRTRSVLMGFPASRVGQCCLGQCPGGTGSIRSIRSNRETPSPKVSLPIHRPFSSDRSAAIEDPSSRHFRVVASRRWSSEPLRLPLRSHK